MIRFGKKKGIIESFLKKEKPDQFSDRPSDGSGNRNRIFGYTELAKKYGFLRQVEQGFSSNFWHI